MDLKKYIRSIPDYPKKGILFRDITTLIKDENAFAETINQIVERSKKFKFNPPLNKLTRKHLNLLFLHSSSDLYGASKILINVVRIVKKNGHEPIVVLSEIGPLSKLFEAENIAVYIIRLGILRKKYFSVIGIINRIKYILKAKKELIQLALDKKIDIIYSNTSVVTVGILVAKSLNLRHIFHVHEIITPKFLANIINTGS